MINNRWLRYGIIVTVATIVLVADIGLGMYASQLAKSEKPLDILKTLRGLVLKSPTPTPRPPTRTTKAPTLDEFVSSYVGKEFDFTIGGLKLAYIDGPTAARLATTSSGTTIYKNSSLSETVLYGTVKTIKEEGVTLIQKDKEITALLTSPYFIFSHEGGKLMLLSFNDKNIQNALNRAQRSAEGRPAMVFEVKNNSNGWAAVGMIIYY